MTIIPSSKSPLRRRVEWIAGSKLILLYMPRVKRNERTLGGPSLMLTTSKVVSVQVEPVENRCKVLTRSGYRYTTVDDRLLLFTLPLGVPKAGRQVE